MKYIGIYEPKDFALEVAKGNIPNHSGVNKFGFNDAVGTSFETIWYEGGLYPWITTATTLTVESSSVNDTAAGTGAQTVQLSGLDVNYDPLEETVTLNGTTQVTTTNTFYRIHRARVLTAGSTGGLVGDIYIKDDAVTVCAISPTYDSQTLMALYTIPNGYTGYLSNVVFSTGKGKETFCSINTRPENGVFNIKHSVQLRESVSTRQFIPYLKIDEKTDIEAKAMNLNTGSVEISCEFDIILVKN